MILKKSEVVVFLKVRVERATEEEVRPRLKRCEPSVISQAVRLEKIKVCGEMVFNYTSRNS